MLKAKDKRFQGTKTLGRKEFSAEQTYQTETITYRKDIVTQESLTQHDSEYRFHCKELMNAGYNTQKQKQEWHNGPAYTIYSITYIYIYIAMVQCWLLTTVWHGWL